MTTFMRVKLENATATALATDVTENRKTGEKRVDLWVIPCLATGYAQRILQGVLMVADENGPDEDDHPDLVHYAWPQNESVPQATTTTASGATTTTYQRPAGNASNDEWRTWAHNAKGLPVDEAAGMSRTDIQERYPE